MPASLIFYVHNYICLPQGGEPTELLICIIRFGNQTLPCMGGRGLRRPAICYGMGTISMKEDWVHGAPPHSHTQLHMQGLGHFCGIGQGLPSTVIFWLRLLLPYR